MTWFGTVSAIGALPMGVLLGVSAYFQFASRVSGWIYVGAALMLLIGGYRTLRKMSGGLRLLAGAWGFAAGLMMLPIRTAFGGPPLDAGGLALAAVGVVGLALTVLHKETKKA